MNPMVEIWQKRKNNQRDIKEVFVMQTRKELAEEIVEVHNNMKRNSWLWFIKQ